MVCLKCGHDLVEGVCENCGFNKPVKTNSVSSVSSRKKNSSGKKCRPDELPNEVHKLSWGGFWFAWIWGIFNGVPISFLSLLFPGIFNIVLLIKGRQWAWEGKLWDSAKNFDTTQNKWGMWGLIFLGISILITIILMMYSVHLTALFGTQA